MVATHKRGDGCQCRMLLKEAGISTFKQIISFLIEITTRLLIILKIMSHTTE